jgi:hypothetical protein
VRVIFSRISRHKAAVMAEAAAGEFLHRREADHARKAASSLQTAKARQWERGRQNKPTPEGANKNPGANSTGAS